MKVEQLIREIGKLSVEEAMKASKALVKRLRELDGEDYGKKFVIVFQRLQGVKND